MQFLDDSLHPENQDETIDETLTANGLAPNRKPGVRNRPLRAA